MGGPGSGRKKGGGKGIKKTSSAPYVKAAKKQKKQDAADRAKAFGFDRDPNKGRKRK